MQFFRSGSGQPRLAGPGIDTAPSNGAGRWLTALITALVLTACASAPQIPPSLDRAIALERAGDEANAGRVYEALAQQNEGDHRSELALDAARAYSAAKLADDATRALTLIEEPISPQLDQERSLVLVEVDLARGTPEEAWQRVNALNLPRAPAQVLELLRLKERVAFAAGRLPDAIATEDQIEPWLSTAQQIRQSRVDLLVALRDAVEQGAQVNPQASPDSVVRGWLELAPLAVAAARNPNGKIADIEAWLARHPNHPADEIVRRQLLARRPLEASPEAPATVVRAVPPPSSAVAAPSAAVPPLPPPVAGQLNIGLLLPLSGRTASAAMSVRDGFMTAFYHTPVAQRPRVRIYDTSVGGAADAINHAVQEGANFIVGPLTREAVLAAADLTLQRPPILALNFLPAEHAVPAAFYQFALSPEDEARSAARRILEDGHRMGAALVPDGDWGNRVLNAFKEEMQAGGGTVFASATLDTTDTDYSDAVMQVLAITESDDRHHHLEQILGTKLQFQPRRRNDIEFLFTPAPEASTERLLRPQLRFYYAGSVPTYATSDAYDPDPHANEDLEGLIFPEMPWMLGGDLTDSVRSAARAAWPTGGPRRGPLYAFGYDAFNLAQALRNPSAPLQIDGLTGHLTLDAQHRVHRDLSWAQLHNGEAHLLPPSGASASAQ